MNSEFVTSWFNNTPTTWLVLECLGALVFIIILSVFWSKLIDSSIRKGIEKQLEAPQHLSYVVNQFVHLREELEMCTHLRVSVFERLVHFTECTSQEKFVLKLDLLKIILPEQVLRLLFGFLSFAQTEPNNLLIQTQSAHAEEFLAVALRQLDDLINALLDHEDKEIPLKRTEES
jgi:hypothetical protein